MERNTSKFNESKSTPCFTQELLTEEDKKSMPILLIPKCFLYGVQPKETYSGRSRKEVERILAQKEGKGYLGYIKKPTLVVPLFMEGSTLLAITDGHHRARYVDRTNVPCRIATVEQATRAYNQNADMSLSVGEYSQDLLDSVGLALRSFDSMPTVKQPHLLRDITDMESLLARFEHLPNLTQENSNEGYDMWQDVEVILREYPLT